MRIAGMLGDIMSTVQTQIQGGEAVSVSPGRPRSGYWIFSPWQDMAFIVLTPLPILLTFAAARRGGWMDGLITFLLALATAHYLPGILRAYGDRALLQRFRLRLILAPLFLFSATAACAYW